MNAIQRPSGDGCGPGCADGVTLHHFLSTSDTTARPWPLAASAITISRVVVSWLTRSNTSRPASSQRGARSAIGLAAIVTGAAPPAAGAT
jgi:hypothetical protein